MALPSWAVPILVKGAEALLHYVAGKIIVDDSALKDARLDHPSKPGLQPESFYKNRRVYAANALMEMGMSERGACAAVGNFCQESGPNLRSAYVDEHKTDRLTVVDPPGLGSQGIAQWRQGRRKALEAYCAQRHLDKEALLSQLNFACYELDQDYPALWSQLTTSTTRTIENLTANFSALYERPSKKYEHLDKRIAYAKQTLRELGEV